MLTRLFGNRSHCLQSRLVQVSNRALSTIFNDPEDTMIDIGVGKPSYRGSLVVVPTPIGNLGDISLRQFEALTKSDIIACEDTRKTGKMLELILDRRMKDRFKNTFGVEWESFFDEDEAKQAPKDKKQSNNNADTEQPEQS